MMAARSDTALNESLITLREQKRLFDDLWLLSLFVMLLALGVPWFLRVLAIDFASVSWSLFIYGVLFLAISMAANSLEDRRLLSAATNTLALAVYGPIQPLQAAVLMQQNSAASIYVIQPEIATAPNADSTAVPSG